MGFPSAIWREMARFIWVFSEILISFGIDVAHSHMDLLEISYSFYNKFLEFLGILPCSEAQADGFLSEFEML